MKAAVLKEVAFKVEARSSGLVYWEITLPRALPKHLARSLQLKCCMVCFRNRTAVCGSYPDVAGDPQVLVSNEIIAPEVYTALMDEISLAKSDVHVDSISLMLEGNQ